MFGKRRTFGNLAGHIGGAGGVATLAQWTHTQFDPTANWRDVEWVRSRWPGRLILKGVMDAEDARFALSAGADAVVVSNHGGRQLDGAPRPSRCCRRSSRPSTGAAKCCSTAASAPDRIWRRRSRSGARGGMIGKSFLFALAAGGQAGVTRALEIIRDELRVTLALTGTRDVAACGPHMLRMQERLQANGP